MDLGRRFFGLPMGQFMARLSSDREDLMAELITYFPRASFSIPEFTAEIVAGTRTDGRWSVFFGGDPVYHFDADGRLRRAFVQGQLYRSEGRTLCRLKRQESESETVLLRHDLSETELSEFRRQACDLLVGVSRAIYRNEASLLNAVPPGTDFLPDLAILIEIVLDAHCELAEPLKRG
ncbi:MAG: hypothetical protein JWM11_7928 [Planctomycetaceae bacterium]|nr:hypothetical protein [Planctomycetaceae bacterium]